MKSTRDVRGKADNFDSGDLLKKAIKLEPIKKSGKEKRTLYGGIDEDDDLSLENYKKRDSILDYFDDGEDVDQDETGDEDQDQEVFDELEREDDEFEELDQEEFDDEEEGLDDDDEESDEDNPQ